MFNFNTRSLEKDNYQNYFNENDRQIANEQLNKENINLLSRNYENAMEILLKERVNLETCSGIIYKEREFNNIKNENNPLNFFKPNFMVSSDKNDALYLLFPRIGKDKKIVYQLFCFLKISDKVDVKEFYLKFESKNKKGINKINLNNAKNLNEKPFEETEFEVSGIEIHHKNQNQLCFFSKDKISFIKDLNSLKDLKTKEIIECPVYHELDFQYKNKNIFYRKFKFSEFDDYFGLLSSDNIFSLYSIDNALPEIIINFETILVDFDFGKGSEMYILQPFSIFFLKENGEILTCSPIFPKLIKTNELNSLEKRIDEHIGKADIITTNENKEICELTDVYHNSIDNPIEEKNEDIFIKILKNLKKCIKFKKNEGPDPKLEQNKIFFNNKKEIEINHFLNSFNMNITFQKINILEKNLNLIDETRNSRSLPKFNLSEKAFYKKYSQLHVLSTFPVTFLRVFENNVLEIISMMDEIRPLSGRKNIHKIEDLKIPAALTEIINFNIYQDMDLADLKISRNKLDSSQILINNINDLYLLKINNNYLHANQSQIQYKKNELRKIIKIDYLKKKNIENVILGFFGVDFLYRKGEMNQIIVIKTNSENQFSPYFFSTLSNTNTKSNENINSQEDLRNFKRIRHHFEKVLTNKKAKEYFSKLEHSYKQFIQVEYNSTEIKNLDYYKKPFQIDKQILEKIMESGISNNIEGFFYYIFNYYNNFFSDKSFYLVNKMNVIQGLYDKLEFFKMKEKQHLLKKINFNINKEIKNIQDKKTLIIKKLGDLKIKLSKVYLTQENFKKEYVLFKEKISNEMTNVVDCLKKNMRDMSSYLLELEKRAKNLVILRNKFNAEHIDQVYKSKMVLFTEFFLNFFDSVAKLKNDVI